MIKFFIFFSFLLFNKLGFADCSKARDTSRIVVAGGSITEILFFLNESQNIVAVDTTSNFPEEAQTYPSIGYVRNLSAEGILSMSPTLIIGEDDMGPPNIITQLKKLGIDVKIVEEIQSSEGIIEKIKCVGKILDIEEKSNQIIKEQMYPSIEELDKISSIKGMEEKKVMLILSMKGSSPIVAGKNTSGDSFIKMVGAKNIYDSIDGWQTVSEESIINYNPDFIILPERELHKNSNVNSIRTNSIFANTEAGKRDNFISDDGMAILGFGPRTIFSALRTAKIISQQVKQ